MREPINLEDWIPEPTIEDNSPAKLGESNIEWVKRSTNWKGKSCRAFLKHNLAALPTEWQENLIHDLERRFSSAFFEIVCARTLQTLGATLEIEAEQKNAEGQPTGKKPDFIAHFEDGSIIVEATTTILDSKGRDLSEEQSVLIEIIEAEIPEGWNFFPWSLPLIGPADSKKQFRKIIRRIMALLPDSESGTPFQFEERFENGILVLEILPKVTDRSFLAGPVNNAVDDVHEKIEKAIKRKRRQVCQSPTPVVLAINLDGMGAEDENFEQVLYGESWYNIDTQMNGFTANGLFTGRANRDQPPTYAAILAFFNVGWPGWESEPILFVNPRFKDNLPKGLLVLEHKLFKEQENQIISVDSKIKNLTGEMRFP